MKRKPNLFKKILFITDKYLRSLDFLKVHDPAEFNFDNKDNQKIIDIGCCKESAINTMRKLTDNAQKN